MSLTHREEKILEAVIDGSSVPFDPVTRREKIFAKAAGEDIELAPPITKEEQILSALAAKGSGGSSDFSTAKVTIIDLSVTDDKYGTIDWPLTFDIVGITEEGLAAQMAFNSASDVKTAVLYNNQQTVYNTGMRDGIVSVSGNAELVTDTTDPRKTNLVITGDCTLSIGFHK